MDQRNACLNHCIVRITRKRDSPEMQKKKKNRYNCHRKLEFFSKQVQTYLSVSITVRPTIKINLRINSLTFKN